MSGMVMECIDRFYYLEFCQLIEQHMEQLKIRNIVIFGAGIMGLQLSYVLKEYNLNIYAFSDNNSDKWGTMWGENPVVNPQTLTSIDNVFVFLAMAKYWDSMAQLEKMKFRKNDNLLVVAERMADKYVKDFIKKNASKTLVLGDCILNTVSLCEQEKESLFEKFDRSPDIKVLAQNGTYMRFYYNILQMCIHNMQKLNKVLLLFSIDIFNNQYHLLPANQHKDILDKVCKVSKEHSNELCDFVKEVEIRNKSNVINFSSPNRSIENTEMILCELKNHTKVNYLYHIKKENESLEYLGKLIKMCRDHQIECICFFLPVNYEMGLDFFSNEFIEKYEKNKAVVCDCIVYEKGVFCDMSYQLHRDQFIAIRSTNEGIYSEGRNEIYSRVKMYL